MKKKEDDSAYENRGGVWVAKDSLMPVMVDPGPKVPAPVAPKSAATARLEAELAALQERILAGAMELGHDGTTFPLYHLIVALRRYIGDE